MKEICKGIIIQTIFCSKKEIKNLFLLNPSQPWIQSTDLPEWLADRRSSGRRSQ
jgi:hypothetical protein